MRSGGTQRFLAAFGLMSSVVAAFAVTGGAPSGNPYDAIINRNAFDLKPLDPPPPPVTNAPPSNIKLTGISTLSGPPRAFLMVQEGSATTPPRSCILSENERDGGVQVLAINVADGSVKVDNGGSIAILTFDKDGNKLPPGPPAISIPPPAPYVPPQAVTSAPPTPETPEGHVQEVMIEVNRQRYIDSGDARAKLLPPTSLTSLRDDAN